MASPACPAPITTTSVRRDTVEVPGSGEPDGHGRRVRERVVDGRTLLGLRHHCCEFVAGGVGVDLESNPNVSETVPDVWVGTDDNAPTGLTGSRGALPVWSSVIAELSGEPLRLSVPEGMVAASVDYATGRQIAARCDNAVTLGLPEDAQLDTQRGCGGRRVAARALDWLRDRL